MPQAATQDDDLLIIADDSSESDSGDIDFSFDFGDESDKAPSKVAETEDILAVEDTTIVAETQEETSEIQVETEAVVSEDVSLEIDSSSESETSSETEASFDLGIDLSDDTPTAEIKEESSSAEEEAVTETQEASFDLGISDDTTGDIQEEVSVEDDSATTGGGSTGDDSSMNDILSATIAKLTARKVSIASQKEEKLKHEDEIKAQITALQDEHAGIEQELTGLDSESNKITANIDELEGMKMDPVKEHNAKRVAKTK